MDTKLQEELYSIFGDKVYQVGGSVRDELLGIEPKDYDFATPLTPDEMVAILESKSKKVYKMGIRFGTIGTMINGKTIEITTFRGEKYEPGNRKPTVEFLTDITADLGRRDFTINAMAKKGNKLIDPFNGHSDLAIRLIRAVGNPTHRFEEDPLRMIRAVLFAGQLNFSIEKNTLDSIQKYAYRILQVSKERWMIELDKILMMESMDVMRGLALLFETGLLKFMIPELYIQYNYNQNNPHHKYPLHYHTILVVAQSPKDINMRWAALLHDIAKPFTQELNERTNYCNYLYHDLIGVEFTQKIAKYLNWSNERRVKVKDLVLNHLREDSPLRQYDNVAK